MNNQDFFKIALYFFITSVLILGFQVHNYYNNIKHMEFYKNNPVEKILKNVYNQTIRENYETDFICTNYQNKIQNPMLIKGIKLYSYLAMLSFFILMLLWKEIPSIKENNLTDKGFFYAMTKIILIPFIETKQSIKDLIKKERENAN